MSGPSGGAADPLPPAFGVVLDPNTQVLDGGRTLLGGAPLRLLRLSPAGAAAVERWRGGGLPTDVTERALARRLCGAGVAHPRPPAGAGPDPGQVTVVVPVRDRAGELRACLASLQGMRTLVVDDGSRDPHAVVAVAAAAGATVLRREVSGGPGAARNTGLAAAGTELVAFVDSDCVAPPGWLTPLLPHFADPRVAAVAPRIVAADPDRDSRLARYEAARASLDRGGREGYVRAGGRVPYVPAAALLVRRVAVGTGFAPLHVGEDVDLVWRLAEDGWLVRYEPAATVAHRHRTRPVAFLRRRADYGTSAAPLALRHPGRLPAVSVNPWSAAAWTLAIGAHPVAATGVTVSSTVRLAQRLRGRTGTPYTVATRLAGRGTLGAGRLLASATTRAWLPVVAVAATRSRTARRALAVSAVLPALAEWRERRPALDPVTWTALVLADDAAYCAGVWAGCLRHRTLQPLLPSWRAGRVAEITGR